jgi:polyhydroxybutyrate depolymerase
LGEQRLPRSVPTLFIIGDSDPLVPLAGGHVATPWRGMAADKPPVRESLDRWARAIGCRTPAVLVDEAAGVKRERYEPDVGGGEFLVYTVTALGHHWPGGRAQLNPRLAGAPSNRLDATRAIWEFFAPRRLEAAQ